MTTLSSSRSYTAPRWPLSSGRSFGKWLTGLLAVLLLAACWQGADMRPFELMSDLSGLAAFLPPDFYQWKTYLQELITTLQIAVWGTALAVACAVPCSLLCASNFSRPWVYQPLRCMLNAAGSIHEILFAMLFVTAVGLGPFAGVLALCVPGTAVLTKLFVEVLESIGAQRIEAPNIEAPNGRYRLQQIIHQVLPQAIPAWSICILHRFESSVRAAVVVGLVGAGGIGVTLWEIIRDGAYQKTAAVFIMIAVTVMLSDTLCVRLRKLFSGLIRPTGHAATKSALPSRLVAEPGRANPFALRSVDSELAWPLFGLE